MKDKDIADMIYARRHLSPQACVEEIVIRPQLGDLWGFSDIHFAHGYPAADHSYPLTDILTENLRIASLQNLYLLKPAQLVDR